MLLLAMLGTSNDSLSSWHIFFSIYRISSLFPLGDIGLAVIAYVLTLMPFIIGAVARNLLFDYTGVYLLLQFWHKDYYYCNFWSYDDFIIVLLLIYNC